MTHLRVPTKYLKDDERATCVVASTRILVIGTSQGRVVLATPEGHEINTDDSHRGQRVSGLSLDSKAERVISCALNGSIAVRDMFTHKKDTCNIDEHLICCSWRPTAKDVEVAVGTHGGHVYIVNKKWLVGSLQSKLIFEDDLRQEPVSQIQWNPSGDRLCFSTNHAAYVYNPVGNTKLLVAFHSTDSLPTNPPLLHWHSNKQFIMARGKRLDWCEVGTNMKVTKRLEINETVCVLSQLDAHCLACTKEEDGTPKLVVFNHQGEVLSEQELKVLGKKFGAEEYRYCHCRDRDTMEDWYYIVTPENIVLVKRQMDFSSGHVISF